MGAYLFRFGCVSQELRREDSAANTDPREEALRSLVDPVALSKLPSFFFTRPASDDGR